MSKVFFTKELDKVDQLFDAAGIGNIISKDDFVALKIHFGERGNTAYLKPERTKPLVKKVKSCEGKPFWTDANTLYQGSRRDSLDHLQTAFDHGYTFGKTGAQVLIADGLEGKACQEIRVNYKHFKKLFIAPLILEADALIAVTHFKGHEVTGFGGAIKNLGMGCASRAGKLEQHADCDHCDAKEKCRKKQTLDSCWVGSSTSVQEKMTEYAAGVTNEFKNKIACITFITDVSENCDCYNYNSKPVVPDIGILASFDPAAIDQAGIDLVNQAAGKDIFKKIWTGIDFEIQLKYAEELGLGTRKYELTKI